MYAGVEWAQGDQNIYKMGICIDGAFNMLRVTAPSAMSI